VHNGLSTKADRLLTIVQATYVTTRVTRHHHHHTSPPSWPRQWWRHFIVITMPLHARRQQQRHCRHLRATTTLRHLTTIMATTTMTTSLSTYRLPTDSGWNPRNPWGIKIAEGPAKSHNSVHWYSAGFHEEWPRKRNGEGFRHGMVPNKLINNRADWLSSG